MSLPNNLVSNTVRKGFLFWLFSSFWDHLHLLLFLNCINHAGCQIVSNTGQLSTVRESSLICHLFTMWCLVSTFPIIHFPSIDFFVHSDHHPFDWSCLFVCLLYCWWLVSVSISFHLYVTVKLCMSTITAHQFVCVPHAPPADNRTVSWVEGHTVLTA